jgi:hypothetical protein
MATPPDFSVGQVLTSAVMNQVGLWLIKTQTVGTTVASVTVSDVFSADYNNYLVTYNQGNASTATLIGLRVGTTATGYRVNYIYTSWNNTVVADGGTTRTSFERFGRSSTTANNNFGRVEIYSPFLAANTRFVGNDISAGDGGSSVGFVDNTTSYTAFSILPASGTLTGGIIRVYGYNL